MSCGAASHAISVVQDRLKIELGAQLRALILYGSLTTGSYQFGQSDVNLVAVVEEGVDLHHLRNVLKPVWRDQGTNLLKVPLIATQKTFERHLRLNPVLAQHFALNGSVIEGGYLLPDQQQLDAIERLSWFATDVVTLSTVLAPSLLSEKEAIENSGKVRSLYRQYFNEPADDDDTPLQLLLKLQRQILIELNDVPNLTRDDLIVPDPPPLLSDLRAIYEMENRLILILPDLDPKALTDKIESIDWQGVANRITDQYRGLCVSTPAELRLILQYNSSADLALQSYDHAWGMDPLVDIQPESWRVYRDLGRYPSELLLSDLPHAYITTEDADLAMLVHDFQNKLLNIQLRNELLRRIDQLAIELPPFPLPERDQPIQSRIDAIFAHLDWWADLYTMAMTDTMVDEPNWAGT